VAYSHQVVDGQPHSLMIIIVNDGCSQSTTSALTPSRISPTSRQEPRVGSQSKEGGVRRGRPGGQRGLGQPVGHAAIADANMALQKRDATPAAACLVARLCERFVREVPDVPRPVDGSCSPRHGHGGGLTREAAQDVQDDHHDHHADEQRESPIGSMDAMTNAARYGAVRRRPGSAARRGVASGRTRRARGRVRASELPGLQPAARSLAAEQLRIPSC
jgi:hypothetical protein